MTTTFPSTSASPTLPDLFARRWRLVGTSVAIAALASLTACGGDGDAGTPAPPPGPQGFTVTVASSKAVVMQGEDVTLDATITRDGGFDGAIDLTVTGLPEGVSADPVQVAAGATTATIVLHATDGAAHSLPTTVAVKGTSGALTAQQAATVTVRGGPGALDTSFGAGGRAIVPVGPTDDYAEAMVVQPDGKVLVAGWGNGPLGYAFEVVRLDRDGALDTTFGDGGRVVTKVGNGAAEVHAIALQADGKILVAGSVDEAPQGKRFAMVRYAADGSVDTTFGTNGQVITSFGSQSDEAFAIAVQPDGRIVLGGHTNSGERGVDFALARYTAAGQLDATFGTGGLVVTPIRALDSRDSVYALALQTVDGELRIVAVGGESDFVLQRYHADGSVDASFAVGGHPEGEFDSVIGAARAVTIDAQNRIVVAGHIGHDFALMRLKADGLPDDTFGAAGQVVTPVSVANWDEAQAVAVDAQGRIVVGGWAYAGNGSAGDFAIVRYTAVGSLDPTFGAAGLTLTPVAANGKADEAYAMTLQVDDRVPTVRALLAGSANGTDRDFAVTRYWQ